MKKHQLKKIIKESLQENGYSRFYPGGKTPGLTTDVMNKILLRIAQGKGTEEEPYEGDPERGNKILDTADQENVDRILRGEEPQYEEVNRMQELAGLKKEIKINNPTDKTAIENEDGTFTLKIGGRKFEGYLDPEDEEINGNSNFTINDISEEDLDFIFNKIGDEDIIEGIKEGDESFIIIKADIFRII